jgi:hypothetical protein
MVVKARADAVVAEARRRGTRGRRARTAATTRVTPSPDFRFDVSSDSTAVVAVADGAVRFPDPERVGLRNALRVAITELDIREGQLLRRTFVGPLPPTDVENRVLLNISPPQRCLRHGFASSRTANPSAGWTCGYRYRAVSPKDAFELWRPRGLLAEWQNVPLAHGLTAAAIGGRCASGGNLASQDQRKPRPQPTVTSPQPLSLNEINAVADGVVAAAQWTRTVDPAGLDRLTANLAGAGIPRRAPVSELLRDASGAGGGHCDDGLIAKHGRVDPDDHLVIAGFVHARTEATSTSTLTAVLHGTEPVSGGTPST